MEIRVDPETDSSGARYVTRVSVQGCWRSRHEEKRGRAQPAAVSLAEVARLTGEKAETIVDLVGDKGLEPLTLSV